MANNTCPTGLDPNSLDWCDGQTNTPGIRSKIYVTSKQNIVKWPTLANPETETDPVKLATYQGNFTLAAGKYWEKIDLLSDKSPITSETQGDKPSVTTLNKATFFHPGATEKATAYARKANNADYVYLIQTRAGDWRLIGNESYQTKTKVSQKLGDTATSEMGTTIEVEVTDIMPAPFYTGEILTEDGILNASTEASISLTSATGTKNQSVAANTAISLISYYYTGTLGTIAWSTTTPAGINTDTTEDGIVKITGTPTTAGTYTYTIPVTGDEGISASATGTITVA